MKVVALISGGKDSCFNMMQCIAAGHEIVALANLTPISKTEIDSYMYQSVGFEAIDYIAAALDLPLYRQQTHGVSHERGKVYEATNDEDEVEDLFKLLQLVKEEMEIEAVSVGAILSDYQRVRVENVCVRLGLVPLAYLWQRDQKDLLNEMIKCEVDAVVIKVAALGLDPFKHLGRTLSSLLPHLHSMHEKYGLNVCGEGGEYETLTLDCPLFKSRIVIEKSEVILHSNDPIAPVGYLKLVQLSLETKLPVLDLHGRFDRLPLKDSDGYVTDYDGIEAADLDEAPIDPCDEVKEDLAVDKIVINQKPSFAKSSDGCLWIGGLHSTCDDFASAMLEVSSALQSILSENGHTVQDVCSVAMFISDMDRFSDLNRIYCETFKFPNPPSRACVEVPSKCPITLTALSWTQPAQTGDFPVERHTMHVQSRSHWAPANIGPYSQAVKVGDFIHLAGQIGLVPGSLELVKGGVKPQCQLALRHVGRLLTAVDSNINVRDVVQAVCYLTDVDYVEAARKMWEERTNNAIVNYVVVVKLPKEALVEWHVWAHKHNNQFEYEETGKCVESFSISIYRRWNYENNVAAIVSHMERSEDGGEFSEGIFKEAIDYSLQKLSQGHEDSPTSVYNIKIFCPLGKIAVGDGLVTYLEEISQNSRLVYTFIPVLFVKNEHTYLSISGVRNE